eukprot:749282-Hanusia_phi.AAC.4
MRTRRAGDSGRRGGEGRGGRGGGRRGGGGLGRVQWRGRDRTTKDRDKVLPHQGRHEAVGIFLLGDLTSTYQEDEPMAGSRSVPLRPRAVLARNNPTNTPFLPRSGRQYAAFRMPLRQ